MTKHWTYVILDRYIPYSLYLRWALFSPFHYMQYIWLYDTSWPILFWLLSICMSSYFNQQIRDMIYWPSFRVASQNKGTCSMFYCVRTKLLAMQPLNAMSNIISNHGFLMHVDYIIGTIGLTICNISQLETEYIKSLFIHMDTYLLKLFVDERESLKDPESHLSSNWTLDPKS